MSPNDFLSSFFVSEFKFLSPSIIVVVIVICKQKS